METEQATDLFPDGFVSEILRLLDRIEIESDSSLANQRFAIAEKHGLTVNFHDELMIVIGEKGFYYAVAMELSNGYIEYSDADVYVQAQTRKDAIKEARRQLREKGYKIISKWEL